MNQNLDINFKWHALYTKAKHEFKAAKQMQNIKVEFFLPTTISTRQWSDRKKKIESVLFPNYIFIHANDEVLNRAIQQNTIVSAVKFAGKVSVIPDLEMINLKTVLKNNQDIIVTNEIEPGTKVRIESGPFKDAVGTVRKFNNDTYFCVGIDLLNRYVNVKLSENIITSLYS
jgi:transcription antitermination factor NusG